MPKWNTKTIFSRQVKWPKEVVFCFQTLIMRDGDPYAPCIFKIVLFISYCPCDT